MRFAGCGCGCGSLAPCNQLLAVLLSLARFHARRIEQIFKTVELLRRRVVTSNIRRELCDANQRIAPGGGVKRRCPALSEVDTSPDGVAVICPVTRDAGNWI